MRTIRYLTLLLVTSVVTGFAQPVGFTLQQAVDYAVENGYSVRNKAFDYEISKKTVKETAASGLPQIGVGAEMNYNIDIPQQPVPAQFIDPTAAEGEFVLLAFGVPYQSSYRANLNQLIFDGSYFVALMASRVFKDISRLDLEESKTEITEQVYNAYGNVVISKELISLLEDNLESSRKILKENRSLFEEGFLEEQDVDQLEITVANLENNIEDVKNQSRIAMMTLKLIIGYPQNEALTLTDDINTFAELNEFAGEILETRFDLDTYVPYRSAETSERAAYLALRNEQMSYLPKLSGSLNYSRNNFSDDFNLFNLNNFSDDNAWVPFSILGLNLQWDIFTGLRRNARTQQARIDLDRAQMNKKRVEEQAHIDYQQAKGDLNVAIKSMQTNKRNRDLAKKILENTRVKYREGLSGSLDLSQAENQFLETERNYINALLQLVSARAKLERLIGKYNTY